MKYIALAVLLLTAACSLTITDTRDHATAAATRTARAVLPLPPVPGGSIRFTARITPTVLPDWSYSVTPTPEGK
jgi:hypothetical protein